MGKALLWMPALILPHSLPLKTILPQDRSRDGILKKLFSFKRNTKCIQETEE